MGRFSPFIPPLLWMGVIFVFSTSGFGGEQTGSYVEAALRLILPGLSHDQVHSAHHLVRKLAHFVEFGVLALLWLRALSISGAGGGVRAAVIALTITAFYAASDEFHQSFVPNRTASAVDVLIDTCGALVFLAVLVYRNKKARQPGAP